MVLSLLVAGALGAATLGLAPRSSAHSQWRPNFRDSALLRKHHRPNAKLAKHFAILRARARAASDSSLPQRMVVALGEGPPSSQFGVNVSQAEEATPSPGVRLWLVPGSSGVCVVDETGIDAYATACYGLSAGADAAVSLQAGNSLVGFVPDGNSSISVSMPNGQVVVAPVNTNSYVMPLPSLASAAPADATAILHYSNAAGPQAQSLGLVDPATTGAGFDPATTGAGLAAHESNSRSAKAP